MTKDPVRLRLYELLGTGEEIARRFGLSKQSVSAWQAGKVPAQYCPLLEEATCGLVTCEELNSSVPWGIVRGRKLRTEKKL